MLTDGISACITGGRDLPAMQEFINSQKVSLLQETEA